MAFGKIDEKADPLFKMGHENLVRLAKLLRLPENMPLNPDGSVSRVWLDGQREQIRTFKGPLRRGPTLAEFFRLEGYRQSKLCKAHHDLTPAPMAWCLRQMGFECSIHVDRIRGYLRHGHGNKVSREEILDVITFVERISGIASLYVPAAEFEEHFGDGISPHNRLPEIRPGCSACVLAVVGGNPVMLEVLRASMLARSKGGEPRLLCLIEAWILLQDQPIRDLIHQRSESLAKTLHGVRKIMSERRHQRKQDAGMPKKAGRESKRFSFVKPGGPPGTNFMPNGIPIPRTGLKDAHKRRHTMYQSSSAPPTQQQAQQSSQPPPPSSPPSEPPKAPSQAGSTSRSEIRRSKFYQSPIYQQLVAETESTLFNRLSAETMGGPPAGAAYEPTKATGNYKRPYAESVISSLYEDSAYSSITKASTRPGASTVNVPASVMTAWTDVTMHTVAPTTSKNTQAQNKPAPAPVPERTSRYAALNSDSPPAVANPPPPPPSSFYGDDMADMSDASDMSDDEDSRPARANWGGKGKEDRARRNSAAPVFTADLFEKSRSSRAAPTRSTMTGVGPHDERRGAGPEPVPAAPSVFDFDDNCTVLPDDSASQVAYRMYCEPPKRHHRPRERPAEHSRRPSVAASDATGFYGQPKPQREPSRRESRASRRPSDARSNVTGWFN